MRGPRSSRKPQRIWRETIPACAGTTTPASRARKTSPQSETRFMERALASLPFRRLLDLGVRSPPSAISRSKRRLHSASYESNKDIAVWYRMRYHTAKKGRACHQLKNTSGNEKQCSERTFRGLIEGLHGLFRRTEDTGVPPQVQNAMGGRPPHQHSEPKRKGRAVPG